MPKQPNKKRIAMFMIVGIILMAGIILKSVSDKIFPETHNLAVMYFSESIKGLTVGSPVVYEGVEVGKVVNIEIMTNPETLEFSIPVYVRFYEYDNISKQARNQELTRSEILQMLIKKGLRARLTTQNLLTGQLMIELLMLPDSPVVLRKDIDGSHLFEIPTTLSTIAGISRDLQDLPLKQITVRLDKILAEFENNLPLILPRFATLAEKLNQYADKSAPQTSQSLNQMNQTLKDVSAAAKSMKNLTDYLEQHPDSLIKGKRR